MLERKGSSFDVASRGEVELCLATASPPDRLSFGNTIKKGEGHRLRLPGGAPNVRV